MQIRYSHWFALSACLLVAALAHGYVSQRWHDSASAKEIDLLTPLRAPIGDWEPNDILPPPKDLKLHTISRKFVSARDGRSVIVSQISGPPGHVTTHTPDVCYPGSGFREKTHKTREVLEIAPGVTAEFYVAEFKKTTAAGSETVRVRWAWTRGGEEPWQAPDHPRFSFASPFGPRILHKLYIVHTVLEEDNLKENDPYQEFTRAFLRSVKVPVSH